MGERFWLHNTDESEFEGEGAYKEMLKLGVMAAWGYCKGVGAERMLNKPKDGETVFFFLRGTGIIARGEADGPAFCADTIFDADGEYHRKVKNLGRKSRFPLTVADLRERTGYHLPARGCIVCQLHHPTAARYMSEHFQTGPFD